MTKRRAPATIALRFEREPHRMVETVTREPLAPLVVKFALGIAGALAFVALLAYSWGSNQLMITKAQAMAAHYRQEFYGTSIRDGRKPITVRVNGACKTWKTRPAEWSLPIKYGLRECDYLTPDNAHRFYMTAAERDATL